MIDFVLSTRVVEVLGNENWTIALIPSLIKRTRYSCVGQYKEQSLPYS